MAKWGKFCDHCGQALLESREHVCRALEMLDDPPYAPLRRVLDLALEQAAYGKGAQRHGQGQPFDKQPMMEIGRMVGAGFCFGQAMKKTQEASRMDPDAAKREILGAINYLAGAYLLLDEV
jgi:hypothetical protein